MLAPFLLRRFQTITRGTRTIFEMRIPDRWLEYSRIGERIAGSPFICFKTPLSEKYSNKYSHVYGLKEDEEFTPAQLCRILTAEGYRLGMVIDLTNTYRYYDGVQELEKKHGIKYVKLKFDPYNPSSFSEVFEMFTKAVKGHVDCDQKDTLIGVHCTHGLNRTGYMICRYLIEECGYSADDAIKAFNEARGHDIEKNIDALQTLYAERMARKDVVACSEELADGRGEEIQERDQDTVGDVRYENLRIKVSVRSHGRDQFCADNTPVGEDSSIRGNFNLNQNSSEFRTDRSQTRFDKSDNPYLSDRHDSNQYGYRNDRVFEAKSERTRWEKNSEFSDKDPPVKTDDGAAKDKRYSENQRSQYNDRRRSRYESRPRTIFHADQFYPPWEQGNLRNTGRQEACDLEERNFAEYEEPRRKRQKCSDNHRSRRFHEYDPYHYRRDTNRAKRHKNDNSSPSR
ncbi:uncharacterized protein LOC135696453 isoform X2 [Rhopilema esculentum]|uniref:uncharacterized protein LOC135696453 isoform X2 n=1 Tax=Rhopilema esculentum TaxID=499914 RepID=UPI0031DB7882